MSVNFHSNEVTAEELTSDLIKRFWWDDGEGMVFVELTDGRAFDFEKFDKSDEAKSISNWIDENWDDLAGKEIDDELETPWGDALKTEDHQISGTRQDDYMPNCPICGMAGKRDDDGEHVYSCGHFVGVYNNWTDDARYLSDYRLEATDRVLTSHSTAGQNEWFFRSISEALDEVMTAGEAAELFGLAEATVRQTINRGQIPARKSGGTWLIQRSEATRRWKK